MLKERLIFGAMMIAVTAGLGWLDCRLANESCRWLAGGGPVIGVIGLILGLASRELAGLIRLKGHRPIIYIAVGGAVVLGLSPWLAHGTGIEPWLLQGLIIWGVMVLSMLAAMRVDTFDGAIITVATTLLIVLYTGFFGSFVVRLRVDSAGSAGAVVLLYFIAITKVTDIAAYFTGRIAGRRRLAPRLSPGKSVEGLIGGIVGATVLAVSLAMGLDIIHGVMARPGSMLPPIAKAAILGVTMAVVGQLGDLFESLIKRDVAVKDSGRSIPGFGGVQIGRAHV